MLTAPHKSWIREREPGRLLHFQKGPTRGNPPNAICYSLGGAGIKESFGALLPRLEPHCSLCDLESRQIESVSGQLTYTARRSCL